VGAHRAVVRAPTWICVAAQIAGKFRRREPSTRLLLHPSTAQLRIGSELGCTSAGRPVHVANKAPLLVRTPPSLLGLVTRARQTSLLQTKQRYDIGSELHERMRIGSAATCITDSSATWPGVHHATRDNPQMNPTLSASFPGQHRPHSEPSRARDELDLRNCGPNCLPAASVAPEKFSGLHNVNRDPSRDRTMLGACKANFCAPGLCFDDDPSSLHRTKARGVAGELRPGSADQQLEVTARSINQACYRCDTRAYMFHTIHGAIATHCGLGGWIAAGGWLGLHCTIPM
jgi:hypothetical protein